jgi:(1->4)-alpha-D-glucan 1-alpha-D-glucosylmutase
VLPGLPLVRVDEGVREADVKVIDAAIERAVARNPKTARNVFDFIRDVLNLRAEGASRESQRKFAGKFQQVTAPGHRQGHRGHDVLHLQPVRLLNEVGGEPAHFGVSPQELHAYLKDRQGRWPLALTALSTHDTKRSEDVRARINVLSEMPDEWRECVTQWADINRHAPPFPPFAADPQRRVPPLPDAGRRVARRRRTRRRHLRRADQGLHAEGLARGQGQHELDVAQRRIRDRRRALHRTRDRQPRLPRQFHPVPAARRGARDDQHARADASAPHRPGRADTYQGTELLDLSLVDPDNRRPVDYERRRQFLDQPESDRKFFVTMKNAPRPPRASGSVLARRLRPAGGERPKADHVFAFERKLGVQHAIVVVPRLVTGIGDWGDTTLRLPKLRGRNVFTGETFERKKGDIAVGELLNGFPVALLVADA